MNGWMERVLCLGRVCRAIAREGGIWMDCLGWDDVRLRSVFEMEAVDDVFRSCECGCDGCVW